MRGDQEDGLFGLFGLFGKVTLMIEVGATTSWGPTQFTLGLDETVWVDA